MTVIGTNLGGVNDWTCEPPFIDRLRMGRPPLLDTAACDPITGLPTQAGSVTRVIALDPCDVRPENGIFPQNAVTERHYVLICDATVQEVQTVWGTIKPVNGKAPFTIKSSSLGGPFKIVATGPVHKFAIMRAEHEQKYLAGQVFNPEFLAALQGVRVIRLLDYNATNKNTFPARRPLPTDGYFWDESGGMPAEYAGMLAKMVSAKLWYPIHHLMTDDQLRETAKALAIWGVPVDFEWSNEFGWTFHKDWAYAAAAAHYNLTKASYFDVLRYYGWRAGLMAKIVSAISPRFRVNLASQASDGASNLPYVIKGWDESGAPRSLIAGYANPSYLNLNDTTIDGFVPKYLSMAASNDTEAFFKNIEDKLALYNRRHILAAKACADLKIQYKITETNQSFFTQAPWITKAGDRAIIFNFAEPLLHAERAVRAVITNIKNAIAAGATEICFFQLSGTDSQYGVWGAMPHITQPPYPILAELKSLAKLSLTPVMGSTSGANLPSTSPSTSANIT